MLDLREVRVRDTGQCGQLPQGEGGEFPLLADQFTDQIRLLIIARGHASMIGGRVIKVSPIR